MMQVQCPKCENIIILQGGEVVCKACGTKINSSLIRNVPEEYFDDVKLFRSMARKMKSQQRQEIEPLREALKTALTMAALYLLSPCDPRVNEDLETLERIVSLYKDRANEDSESPIHKIHHRLSLIIQEVQRDEFVPDEDFIWIPLFPEESDGGWEPVVVYRERYMALQSIMITMAGDEFDFYEAKRMNINHAIQTATQALVF